MSNVQEPPNKLTIQDRVEDFSQKAFEAAEAKKVLIRNLKGLMHKIVRIRRKNIMKGAVYSSAPLGMAQPGIVLWRRVGDAKWGISETRGLNDCGYGEDFQALIGMVVGYEIEERDSGSSVYLIVAAPNDRFEYKFSIRNSEIEVLDGFPPS